jgi:hypothetical protein
MYREIPLLSICCALLAVKPNFWMSSTHLCKFIIEFKPIYVQELVSKRKHHNWRSVAAFVAVGTVVLVLIIVGIVFLAGGSANDERAEAIKSGEPLFGGSSISLEDVVEGKFSPKGFNGTWISGETSVNGKGKKCIVI